MYYWGVRYSGVSTRLELTVLHIISNFCDHVTTAARGLLLLRAKLVTLHNWIRAPLSL